MTVLFKEEIISRNPEETLLLGKNISSEIKPGDTICLQGTLGSGKTQLSKGIISSFIDVDAQEITSPTYTYMNFYEGEVDLCHFDLYRLKSLEEFEKLGFEEYLSDANTISVIEWPDKILSILPKNTHFITIDHLDTEQRLFKLNFRVYDDSI